MFRLKQMPFFVMGALALLTAPAAAQSITARVAAAPATNAGCPTTITFAGQITSSVPGTVQYRFRRSDGALSPVQSVTFSGAGHRQVQTSWQFGGAPGETISGWQQLEVFHPQAVVSNRATFTHRCAGSTLEAAPAVATLRAIPERAVTTCPAQIRFSGTIRSNRAGPVQYRFIRSDGATGSTETAMFDGPGTRSVSTAWQLGGRGERIEGWQQLEILGFGRSTSRRAVFKLICR